jgi:hypothetical protein
VVVAAEWGTGQVFWSLIWIFLFVIWIFLVLRVFADIFRSRDMGAFAKVLWTLFVIVLPYLGVFAYILVRGQKMVGNEISARHEQEQQFRSYIRDVVATDGPVTELERLASLRDRGVIDDEEFARMKSRIVATA